MSLEVFKENEGPGWGLVRRITAAVVIGVLLIGAYNHFSKNRQKYSPIKQLISAVEYVTG